MDSAMKKHKYNIEDITLSIIYAFYLNYHKKTQIYNFSFLAPQQGMNNINIQYTMSLL